MPLEKMITKVVHPRPFRMPSDLQNNAPAYTGASFSLFPLSRKCAPKVLPLAPFWDAFGHQNRTKYPKEPLKSSSENRCDFKCHLDQKNI